ncbi:MAG TPA: glycosyltransferase family 4 protein [Noviherbaspirillum sp.]|nr:glycosyltransferase family 4 protein [Noviherbaspirillum sp.]
MLRLAIVSNELPPYRVPFFQRLAQMPDVDLHVVFCTQREPNRRWELPPLEFGHTFLNEQFLTIRGRYIHYSPGVVGRLKHVAPDVIITGGFNPTHLYAFGYATLKRIPHIAMTDGTYASEQSLSGLHKAVRRFVYARTSVFVAASMGGQRLYESYGIPAERCFRSCLCVDNDAFSPRGRQPEKRFDFLFCGRMEAVKNPFFALNVAQETARRLQRKVSILFVGAGAEEEKLRNAALRRSEFVDAEFNGFAAHASLPELYRSARIFLFPTLWDPWGVVANEACAAGLPVLVTPEAGVAGELVRDGENGFICDLNVNQWAKRATMLLSNQNVWDNFSARSLWLVKEYSYENAANGILEACRHALSPPEGGRFREPV